MQLLKPFSYSRRFPDIEVIGSAFAQNQENLIPLSFGFPAPESLPVDKMTAATEAAMQTQGRHALAYSGGTGVNAVINWIKERSKLREIKATENEILITAGSSQAIDLVTRTLTDPGDEVWVEAPTFFGALKTFQLAETKLASFPIDENGLRVDLVEQELSERVKNNLPLPKLMYVIPNYQNPGGVNLSVDRRKRLAELAYEYNFFIIEDDAYVELSFDGIYNPAIYSYGPERVVYLSTFSKIIAPGLRLGWAIGLTEIIEKMRILKIDGLTSVYVQEVTKNLLDQIGMDEHICYLNSLYLSRKNAMVSAIKQYFGNDVTFHEANGGFFLWITFPCHIDTSEFIDAAASAGVSYIAGKHFFLKDEGYNHMRLCFTFCQEDIIEEAIKRLANTYYEYVNSKQMIKGVN
ncbi:PLP-dependent aminotransferase family protein [Niallia circulans]|jgi:2-aminoadipate transaminase|uniref:Aminotransferase 4 n=1 Tax=Niallia circulans TaxID=1397 RepID=A0A268FI90_NIACI|nr:PLP-dependent aminotransferase family protein [Niallia circulans]AYV66403.1 PLP-dependent aminotransferase family protein [Niallia circulans]NRG30058.1 PLP-dependent aminotransferase family protein [Niallia circulans]PAD85093.1 aminotransferase 4 [Niallia circulans]